MSIAWRATAFTAPAAERWREPLALLVATWAALLALFHRDVADLSGIYWNSTTFGHCLFVPPVIGWLVWQRRAELARLDPRGWWPGLMVVAAGALFWFLGEAAGVAFGRHLGLVVMLQGAVLAILGARVARGLAFPLAYMLFLVPFGTWLEAPLQDFTVLQVMPLLHLFGVPARLDGVLITIPNGWFEVAEACSGAKFVIAMAAFATLVAHVGFASWRRRLLFWAVAMTVPVVANGARAFGTIYAAHLTSVEAATGVDHIVYGWIFFALVMAGVLGLGWRWFDRDPDAPAFDPAALQGSAARSLDARASAATAFALAVIALATGTAVATRTDALPAQLHLPEVPGWRRVVLNAAAPWQPYYPSADHYLFGRYVDGRGRTVDLGVAVFAGQREGHELAAFGQGVLRENDRWVRVDDEPPLAGGRAERITAPGPVERVVATWYRVGGMTTADARAVKLKTLQTRLFGGPQRGTAVHLSSVNGQGGRAAMTDFLAAAGSVATLADRVVEAR